MPHVSASAAEALPREVVFDLRDRSRTGLGRVATETVAAWQALFPDDPLVVLRRGGARYSLRAQREWPHLARAHPRATWVWFHWDVPWWGMPARSVVYVHDRIHRQVGGFVKRTVADLWTGHAMRRAGAVVTVSAATAAQLPRAATVIPNGVQAGWCGPWAPTDYLLTVGEPRPYKNFDLAARVAAMVGVRHHHAWGVSDEELAACYAGARVVLVPSRAEGFGLPLLEAFSAGAPVVASDIPALREVSGGLAVHVPPDDVSAWCDAVRACWRDGGDPDARRRWAATFTWERTARRLREVVVTLG
jgi:glycosyltransferase involved in cell wall biosynthesis